MSFLIDGPWLYANGRAIAELPEETEAACARHRGRVCADERLALPERALDTADLAALPGQ